ncbi:hypothetical protein H2198_002473 [Neophaeococcomyces mojaviensis]|uniref:Uncharacterized protein n=1 Tax=Neophaeococcomyces mojaviensis TaxID=3383035 RepID=A0ACC3AEN1_9EURO|nr:hypothetical protein H2198_002473 [Knufia sp. JES_112]
MAADLSSIKVLLTILSIYFHLTSVRAGTGYDAVNNFCRRLGHASTFKNQKVYINSGLETFADYNSNGQIDPSTVTSGFSAVLMSVNMTSDWGGKITIPIDQDAKHKSGSVAGYKTPPNFKYSALYSGPANSTKLYSFGGTASGYNTSFRNYFTAPDTSYPLWSYDSKTDLWTNIDTSAQGITIPSYGASAEAPDLGLGFYFGGQIDNGTANTTSYLTSPVGVGGMIVIDTIAGTLWNMSTPAADLSNRQGGTLVYTDAFGKSGILLAIGGQSNGKLLSMNEITVFDVGTIDPKQANVNSGTVNTWYTVNATGDAPDPRTDFCTVVTTAQDGSSTNIYLYGGRSSSTIFDDVYVLSLPSFTWTHVYSGTSGRWGMTCQLVSPRQMISIGGADSNNITADCDWLDQGLGLLDLSTVTGRDGWAASNFEYNVPAYEVPVDVVSAIGGNGKGGATKTAPAGGWATPALSTLFAVSVKQTNTNSSSSSNSSTSAGAGTGSQNDNKSSDLGLSTGAKAGIVVGAIILVAICLLVALLVLRNIKKKRAVQTKTTPEHELEENKGLPPGYTQTDSSKAELMTGEKDATVEKDGMVVHEVPVKRFSDESKEQSMHRSEPVELA